MNELMEIRHQIEEVDQELLTLLEKRMSLISQISEIKKRIDYPVYDPQREKDMLNLYASKADKSYWPYIEAIFKSIFKSSKEFQGELKDE